MRYNYSNCKLHPQRPALCFTVLRHYLNVASNPTSRTAFCSSFTQCSELFHPLLVCLRSFRQYSTNETTVQHSTVCTRLYLFVVSQLSAGNVETALSAATNAAKFPFVTCAKTKITAEQHCFTDSWLRFACGFASKLHLQHFCTVHCLRTWIFSVQSQKMKVINTVMIWNNQAGKTVLNSILLCMFTQRKTH